MFFSWWFLLFLASYGFSGAQSNYVARDYRGNDNTDVDSYGGQSPVNTNVMDYSDDLPFNFYNGDDGDRKFNPSDNIPVVKRNLIEGLAKFIAGGIAAVLGLLPNKANRIVLQKRAESDPSKEEEDVVNKIKKNIMQVEASLSDLEQQVSGKKKNQSKRFLRYY